MSDDLKIVLRDGSKQDHGFIASTWANGVYYGSECFRFLPEGVYHKWFPGIIGRILRNPKVITRIACDESNPIWIAGCAVYDSDSLYWIYVKEGFKNQGLARLILAGTSLSFIKPLTSMTRQGPSFAQKMNLTLKPLEAGDMYDRRIHSEVFQSPSK